MKNKVDIGKRLKQARLQAGLSQQDLAEAAGTCLRIINHYENNRIIPRADRLHSLAKAVGKSIGYFFLTTTKNIQTKRV